MSEASNVPSRTRGGVATALWVAAAGAILFWRYTDLLLRPRLWAEDGPTFFLQAWESGAGAIFEPYGGYLHLAPRLIAWAGCHVGLRAVPWLYVYASAAVTLAVVARVFSPRLDFPSRTLVALAIVAVPHTGEVFLTPTNLQWILSLGLVLQGFMQDPGSPGEWAGDIAMVLVSGLSGPFCIFIFPIFAFRAISRRTRASVLLAALVLCAASVQGAELIVHSPPLPSWQSEGAFRSVNWAAVLSARTFLPIAASPIWIAMLDKWLVLLAGAGALFALAAIAFQKDGYRWKRASLLWVFAALVAFSAVKARYDLWDFRDIMLADRYFFVPKVLFLWMLLSYVGGSVALRRTMAAGLTLVVAAALLLVPFRKAERPYYGWSQYCSRIQAHRKIDVTVSPGWKFVVPGVP